MAAPRKNANAKEAPAFPPSGCKARYCWMGNGWKTRAMRRAKGQK